MARSITQTLTLARLAPSSRSRSRLLPHRTQSNQSSSDLNDPLIRKLEDAIHCIIVRRSAPDWLPFLPGSSYWVPPPRSSSNGLAQLLDKLANPITEDESMSITTLRGWPSSSYFIQGGSPHPVDVETTSNCDSAFEDKEG